MSEPWYKNAIIYGVDVRTFFDSNGDGIGDFPGLTAKLDYLAGLGVTCIWVLPFYPSPNRDNGYDISEYLGVHPSYGTLGDVIHFIREAGARSMRVIFDLVMNHTSSTHPWFEAARHAPDSRFREYYVWSDAPPPVPPDAGTIFPGEEQHVWTYDEAGHAYYYHRFYHFEPSLNLANVHVVEEVERVLEFWLCFGISGYRVDAAPHMIERAGIPEAEPDQPHELFKRLRRCVDARRTDVCLIGEADEEPGEIVEFFGDGDELHMLLNFYLNNMLFLALARESAEPLERGLRVLPSIPESCQWCNFVRNLDELDLERLTDDERQDVFDAFGPEPHMRIFHERGIRRRLAPMMGGDERRMKLAFSLVFSLPGSPAIVYGDEIGIGEDLNLDGRMAVRPPMQWSAARNAGFSTAQAKALCRPAIGDGPFSFAEVNVEAQLGEEGSFLGWMRELIHLRRRCVEIGAGHTQVIDPGDDAVLAHRCEHRGRSVVAVHNLSGRRARARIHSTDTGQKPLALLFGDAELLERGDAWEIELPAYGFAWLRAD